MYSIVCAFVLFYFFFFFFRFLLRPPCFPPFPFPALFLVVSGLNFDVVLAVFFVFFVALIELLLVRQDTSFGDLQERVLYRFVFYDPSFTYIYFLQLNGDLQISVLL